VFHFVGVLMNCYGRAAEAANDILQAFENPNSLPAPLAKIFITRKDNAPCRSWSWRNQLIAALHGHDDARGYQQWRQVGRQVKEGEKAFYILSPCVKSVVDEKTGEDKQVVFGYRGTPVFGLSQTEGEPLPAADSETRRWFQDLPLREVADEWGLSVKVYEGSEAKSLGAFRVVGGNGCSIALGVTNLSTWTHELVHAADHRNGNLTELGQHWHSETVAELGGAVLLNILGYRHETDLGGCWEYIQHYAEAEEIDVLKACNLVLDRTCRAVALIPETAEAVDGCREETAV